MTAEELERCGPPILVFRSPAVRGFKFELRSLSGFVPEDTVAIMYCRSGDSFRQCGVGKFKDGAWKSAKRKPLQGDLYWTSMVDER